MAVGVPIAVGGLIVAPDLVRAIGGDEFAGAADALRLLLFAVALAFVSGLLGHSLIAGGRQASALRLGLLALGLNLVANLAASRPGGSRARPPWRWRPRCCWSRAAICWCGASWGSRRASRCSGAVLVAAGVMGGVLAVVSEWPLAALLVLGVLLYGAALWALGGLDPRRLGELRA